MHQILLLGDSLTQRGYDDNGWVASLASSVVRSCTVLNGGLSGYNSRWVRRDLCRDGDGGCSSVEQQPPLVNSSESEVAAGTSASPSPSGSQTTTTNASSTPYPLEVLGYDANGAVRRPLFVTLWLGANDAVFADDYHHVPLGEYRDNLRRIIDWVVEVLRPHHGVLLITPPPVDGRAYAAFVAARDKVPIESMAPNRSLANTRAYRDECLKVAADYNALHGSNGNLAADYNNANGRNGNDDQQVDGRGTRTSGGSCVAASGEAMAHHSGGRKCSFVQSLDMFEVFGAAAGGGASVPSGVAAATAASGAGECSEEVDVHNDDGSLHQWADCFVDGLHFNAKGSAIASAAIKKAIGALLAGEGGTGGLQWLMPAHNVFAPLRNTVAK